MNAPSHHPLGNTPSLPNPQKISLKDAYVFCQKIAKNHYENFPVASVILPKKVRKPVTAIYAFSRTADDFADEKEHEGLRMEKLKDWEKELKNREESTNPIFIALNDTIEKFNIPVSLLSDLLTAFKMDVTVNRYNNFEQLLNYCRYSANPIGRLVLAIMGYPAPKFLEYSDYICTALQLANHWQDVGVDVDKNRVYLPSEDMLRFGYSEADLMAKRYTVQFKRLMSFEVERAMELFEKGKPLCALLPGRLGFEIRLTWLGGTTILKKIRAADGDVFNHRPRLSKIEMAKLAFTALNRDNFKYI